MTNERHPLYLGNQTETIVGRFCFGAVALSAVGMLVESIGEMSPISTTFIGVTALGCAYVARYGQENPVTY